MGTGSSWILSMELKTAQSPLASPVAASSASPQKRLVLVLTSPRKCRPCVSIASAVFTPANHESPYTTRPEVCHGSVMRRVVAVVCPYS